MPLTPQEEAELEQLELEKLRAEKAAATQPRTAQPKPYNPTLPIISEGVAVGEMPLSQHRQVAAVYPRVAPVAAAVIAPPAGLAGWLGLGGVAAGGELLARAFEGKPVTNREAAGEAAKSFVFGATPFPALKGAKTGGAVVQGIKGGLAAGAANTGAQVLGDAIVESEFPSYDKIVSEAKGSWLPATIGFIGGGAGSRLKGVADKKAAFESRRELLKNVGIENPTLGLLDPPKAGWEQHVANTDPVLAQKLGQAQSGVTREFYGRLGSDPGNPAVAAELQKYIPIVDQAEASYQAAKQATQEARGLLAKYTNEVVDLDKKGEDLAPIVTAKVLSAINRQAATLFERNAKLGNAVTNTAKAQELGETINQLFDARSDVARVLYKQTGIPDEAPVFAKPLLRAAVEKALGSTAKDTVGLRILDAIDAAGGPEAAALTPNNLKILRNNMALGFNGTSDKAMSYIDSKINQAYQAATNEARDMIAVQFGPDSLAKWDAAQKFWRDTSQLRDSKLGRSLLRSSEEADHALTTLASNLARGNVDELNKFKEFVEVIGSYPEGQGPAKLAVQTMADALRNAYIEKNRVAGSVDFRRLLGDLNNAATYNKLPVPVEALGFGNLETLRQWQKSLREFKPGEVNIELVDDVLGTPGVKEALQTGGRDVGKVLSKATARAVFTNKVNEEIALRQADMTNLANQKMRESQLLLQKHGLMEEEARKMYEAARKNPVLEAFSGKGKYTLTQELGATETGTVTDLLDKMSPDVAGRLMSGLRKNNSQLADLVERRLLANEFHNFVKTDSSTPGVTGALDIAKVREFFNPIHEQYQSSRLRFLENTIGREKVTRLKKFVTDLAEVDDAMRTGRFNGSGGGAAVTLGGLLAPSMGTAGPSQRITILNKIRQAFERQAYNTVATALTDKDFANTVFVSSRGIAESIGSMPVQKAYLILNDKPLSEELGGL